MSSKKKKHKKRKNIGEKIIPVTNPIRYLILGGGGLALVVILVTAFVVGSSKPIPVTGNQTNEEISRRGDLPDYVEKADPVIKGAYSFASTKKGMKTLADVQCYCGCELSVGHDSLRSCFIKKQYGDDEVVYDTHAAGCDICVNEATDVGNWLKEGKSDSEIKELIASKYSRY